MRGLFSLANLNTGHSRSIKAKKNIFFSAAIKGLGLLLNFLMVPLLADLLGVQSYGVWLTISSVMGWISFMDIGLGNGLRNRLAESLARKDLNLARSYIATSYVILTLMIAVLALIFLALFQFINWELLLNIEPGNHADIEKVILVLFLFLLLQFVFKNIGTIAVAEQNPAINGLLIFLSNLGIYTFLFFLPEHFELSLVFLAVVFGFTPLIIYALATVWLFSFKYKTISPGIGDIDLSKSKDLISLGVQFFIIQISFVVLYGTDNLIVAYLFGSAEVVVYTVALKYFNLPLVLFSVFTTPLWSAFTDAFAKKDHAWIRNVLKKAILGWGIFALGTIILLLCSDWLYKVWMGDRVQVPFQLSVFMCIFAIVKIWGGIFSTFINGVGKVKIQLWFSIANIIVNVPLSIFFAKYMGLGSGGVILASTICLSYGPYIAPFHTRSILNKLSLETKN